MKIVFVRECLPIPQTGNEHYKPGMNADFLAGRARWLIEQGFAEPLDKPPAPVEIVKLEPMPDYAAMKLSELKPLAIEAGWNIVGLRKAEIVAALESSND